MCFLVFDIGDQITPSIPEDKAAAGTTWKQWRHEFWGWGSDKASKLAAVEKYANAIATPSTSIITMDSISMQSQTMLNHLLPTKSCGPMAMTLFRSSLKLCLKELVLNQALVVCLLSMESPMPSQKNWEHTSITSYFKPITQA